MRAISELINLNVEKMLSDSKTQVYVLYQDEDFCLLEGRYDCAKLLTLGYIYC